MFNIEINLRCGAVRDYLLAFDGSIELAFGGKLSIGPAFRVTRVLLVGHIGIGIG
jgi:hypothetical protein